MNRTLLETYPFQSIYVFSAVYYISYSENVLSYSLNLIVVSANFLSSASVLH
jgi:hypothetical protein